MFFSNLYLLSAVIHSYIRTVFAYAGLTSEALSTTFSMEEISCDHLAFLALQIGRGLRRTIFTAVLIRRFRQIICRCWYSLSWRCTEDQASAADSLVLLSPVSGDATSNSVRAVPCCSKHKCVPEAPLPSEGLESCLEFTLS